MNEAFEDDGQDGPLDTQQQTRLRGLFDAIAHERRASCEARIREIAARLGLEPRP